jgi:hypothetical protein
MTAAAGGHPPVHEHVTGVPLAVTLPTLRGEAGSARPLGLEVVMLGAEGLPVALVERIDAFPHGDHVMDDLSSSAIADRSCQALDAFAGLMRLEKALARLTPSWLAVKAAHVSAVVLTA